MEKFYDEEKNFSSKQYKEYDKNPYQRREYDDDKYKYSRKRSPNRSLSPSKRKRRRPTLFDVTPQEMANIKFEMPILADPEQSKKLIITNYPDNVTEEDIMIFLNYKMRDILNNQEVISILKATFDENDKTKAILDLRNEDDATKALALDGELYEDKKMVLERPTNYVTNTNLSEENQLFPMFSGISTSNTVDNTNRLFIGGLPSEMSEENVKELLETFGELKAFNLVKDLNTGVSKGYGFCEYAEESQTNASIKGLNGMEVGTKTLLVQRAYVGAKAPIQPIQINYTLNIGAMTTTVEGLLNMPIKVEAALGGLAATMNLSNTPQKILVLMNLFSVEEVRNMDEDEHKDALEDLRSECEIFGKIKRLLFPIYDKENDIEPPGCGYVFIYYERIDSSREAQEALAGRRFQGRTVITSFYPEKKFKEIFLNLE
jgi:splicing factor U2AF 65 kDa subunit